MNKVVKAFAKIKTQVDSNLVRNVNYAKHELQDIEENKIYNARREKEYKEALKKAEKDLKAAEFKLSDKAMAELQDEITKIFTLPIKTLKVVRTESTTGYLPKILITTGMIHLAPFPGVHTRDDEYFTRFVGQKLGRFLIQYDWSSKHSTPKITMVNLTQEVSGYQAATINHGTPCLGNIEGPVWNLFGKKDFFKLTETLLDYVENTVYGNPYIDWTTFFNRTRPQTIANLKHYIFADYPTHNSEKELKVIESMIPKKEWDILNRDTSKDPTYPRLNFEGQQTHDDCHCEQCLAIRERYELFQEFTRQHPRAAMAQPAQTHPGARVTATTNYATINDLLINQAGYVTYSEEERTL